MAGRGLYGLYELIWLVSSWPCYGYDMGWMEMSWDVECGLWIVYVFCMSFMDWLWVDGV